MRSRGLTFCATMFLPFCGGCFTSQPSAEADHDLIKMGMDQDRVFRALGKPNEVHPIPGQGDSPELPVEQWSYVYTHQSAKILTIAVTLFIGLFFMDRSPYGFDVGFGRDGRVRTVSDVGRRPR